MSFQKQIQILYFNPRSSTRWNKREYLLWPAWVYRVVAPRVAQRKVNILEKAVLGMCRVGAFTAAEIGDKLDIGTDLAALIIKQLSDRGLIDSNGLLTARGLNILSEETLETQDMVAGFIFQDPWTGELWPRFVERLEYVDVKFNPDGFPSLVLGTTGKPNDQRAYMLHVENILRSQPSAREILEAVRKHGKALRDRDSSSDDSEDETPWTSEPIPVLKRISFVEEEPTPVWLATFIYLPETFLSATTWNVCDPFGLGDSAWLRRRLERQIKSKTPNELQNVILGMLDKRKDEDKLESGFADFINRADDEATMKVEVKLTVDIQRWEGLFDNLVAVERTYIEAEALADSKSHADKLDDVLVKAQKAVERLFLVVRETHPTDNSWKLLSPGDKEHNKILLNKLAEMLGFTIPIPHSLVGVKQGKVRSAADYGEGSLRPHLLAALLTARNDSKHSLRVVAQKAPDMLDKLDRLAGLRDKSSHFSNQQLTLTEVSQQISTVYEVVGGMLGITLKA